MAYEPRHDIPGGLRPALDLRAPPADPWRAEHYAGLLAALNELGALLDAGPVSHRDLLDWERRTVPLLHAAEVTRLFARREESFDRTALPAERFDQLRAILLSRKGFG